MKKLLSLLLAVSLLACSSLTAFATEVTPAGEPCLTPLVENPQTPEEMALYNALSDQNAQYGVMPAAEGGHVVNVTTPVDAQFRSRYSSWAWEVLRAVDDADDFLGSVFNINYNIVSNKMWDSSSTDMGALLDEAIAEWGLRDNAALMIAFTGRFTGYGGGSHKDTPYCLIADQGRAANTLTVQHETGHCYGLNHCGIYTCFMYHVPNLNNYNSLDSTCQSIWYTYRLQY